MGDPMRQACEAAAKPHVGQAFDHGLFGQCREAALAVVQDPIGEAVVPLEESLQRPACAEQRVPIVECRDAAVGESVWGDAFLCFSIFDIP